MTPKRRKFVHARKGTLFEVAVYRELHSEYPNIVSIPEQFPSNSSSIIFTLATLLFAIISKRRFDMLID